MKVMMSVLLGLFLMNSAAEAKAILVTNKDGCYVKFRAPDGYWHYQFVHSGPCVQPSIQERTGRTLSCPYAVGDGASFEAQYNAETMCANQFDLI